jgi:hypothetical protein
MVRGSVLWHQMGAELKHAAALDNSVERLIASSAQSSAVVSQGFGGDMAAGAAEVGAAEEATQGGRPIPVRSMEGLWGKQALPMTCSAGYRWFSGP